MSFLRKSYILMPIIVTFFIQSVFFKAEAANIEGLLNIPWSSVNKTIQGQDLEIISQNIAFEVQSIPFNLAQVKSQISVQFDPLKIQGNQTILDTKSLNLKIETSPFQVKKDIVKQIDGRNVIIHLEASCGSIQFSQTSASAQAIIGWAHNLRNVQAQIADFNLHWPQNSWVVQDFQCTGPIGFADLIRNELLNNLREPSAFKDILKNKLQEILNIEVSKIVSRIEQTGFLDIENTLLKYSIKSIVDISSHGFLFKFDITDSNQSDPEVIEVKDSDQVLFTELPSLTISEKGVEKLAQIFLQKRVFSTELNKFEGFNKLLKSRFLQFFVWPDLWHYPKSAVFPLLTRIKAAPSIKLNPQGLLMIESTVESWVESERKKKKWDYLYLESKLSAIAPLFIEDNFLKINIEQAKFNTQFQFGADYKKRFHPRKKIPVNVIETAVEKTLVGKKFQFEIPPIKLNSESQVKLFSIKKQENQNYLLEFK